MISISSDVRKVQKSCYSANVNIDGKHLKQIKKIFNSPFRKRGFGMLPRKNEVKMEKKRLGRGSWFLVSLTAVKVNIVAYLG